jgi:AraC-like DNA-binding protein
MLASVKDSSLNPLVAILVSALEEAGVELAIPLPTTTAAFSVWYLEAIKALELAVSNQGNQQPLYNRDIQMLCRCVISAEDLAEAIQIAIDYSDIIHPRNGRQRLKQADGLAVFSMDTLRAVPTPVSHLVDIVGLFAFYQLFQWLIGSELELNRVVIGPAQRDDVLPFLRLFNAPVLTGKDRYTIEFPADYLQQPVVRSKNELPAFIATFPCEVFAHTDNELIKQVEVLMMAALQQMAPLPTLQELRKTLGLSESTFRRKLQSSGTSYRGLREQCLKAMAQRYLKRQSLSIEQISRQLNFSDDTAFRRAFKSWVGVSPSAWRQQNRAQ